jgi:hypothetical protein
MRPSRTRSQRNLNKVLFLVVVEVEECLEWVVVFEP